MMPLSPLLKEAAFWFGTGCAIAAFVCAAMIVFAISAPGVGSTSAVVRAVGKSVDSIICPERERTNHGTLRQSRRSSYDALI